MLRALGASNHPRVLQLRAQAGRLADLVDHPQLRDARRLLRATQDVLLLGESVLDFVGPQDHDPRRLPVMLQDLLGPDVSLLAVHGGGYHADLLASYLELLAHRDYRPKVLVVALWARGRFAPWIAHPRFGHHDALARLAALDPATPAWRVRGSLRRGSAADFEAFYRLPHPTLAGDLLVGDYARPLKAGAGDLRLLYAYHHGALIEPAALAAVTRLGAAAKALGCAVVAYQTPLSVETGAALLGPAFTERVAVNFIALDAAFQGGAGDVPILPTAQAFSAAEFIDPADGSEHLNDRGRLRLAGLLAEAVRARL